MYLTCAFLFFCSYVFPIAECQEDIPSFFLSAKNVPRIGRNTQANSDFEKFFLKASKSVPRIGRRNDNSIHHEDYDKDMIQKNYKYPTWSDLANRYEYEPELFSNPAYLTQLEEMLGDDPNIHEWDKVRMKRKIPARFNAKQNGIYKI